MTVNCSLQCQKSPRIPLDPLAVFAGSSMPVALVGIPDSRPDGDIVSVSVSIVNADGATFTAPCTKSGVKWFVAFAGSCFPNYGLVELGYRVVATVATGERTSMTSVIGVGDLEILKTTPDTHPGDPTKNYVIKGSDVYDKSRMVDDVQHYVKQTMVYDDEMGAWGASWDGDYILVDGEFQEVSANA
jgi:hypothetical protein